MGYDYMILYDMNLEDWVLRMQARAPFFIMLLIAGL